MRDIVKYQMKEKKTILEIGKIAIEIRRKKKSDAKIKLTEKLKVEKRLIQDGKAHKKKTKTGTD